MKPACPREKSPVKPLSRFIATAAKAKVQTLRSTENHMEVGGQRY